VGTGDFTILLREFASGNQQALHTLAPVVYAELRKLAVAYMRHERPGGTLQPTALIHEAYMQLVRQDVPDFQSRAHFYGAAAHIMRQLLIANARRQAQKRGGGDRPAVEADVPVPAQQNEEFLAVDQALDRLAAQDERKAQE